MVDVSRTNPIDRLDHLVAEHLEERLYGLRKAAALLLVEVGCTVKQVAAISGHETLKEIERYA